MKYVLSALMILMINAQARAASFIEGLEDVPVMEGMKQVPSDSISFGNEESRLVEALLTSNKVGFKKSKSFIRTLCRKWAGLIKANAATHWCLSVRARLSTSPKNRPSL